MAWTAPRVTIYVASCQTRTATELCVRSVHEYAGYALSLVVGDSGSTDGSVEMLEALGSRGWLELDVEPGGRRHAAWLDHWLASSDADYAVFVDSDVEFRRHGWLAQIVATAVARRAGLVWAEFLDERAQFVEPVSSTVVRLAARPAPWLLLVDVARAAALGSSFAFHSDETDAVPEGIVAYDVGARFFRDAERAGLTCVGMPPSFGRAFRHYGGLSWMPDGGRWGRRKRRDLRTVERRLRRLRRRQENGRARGQGRLSLPPHRI
jgi:glycosyltransferase involved in cell wall biosynthesis